MTPLISAVICTHDRAGYLRQAIESVLAQDLCADQYEILIVDNRSNDGTRELVQSCGPRVQYFFEPKLGLSHARNAGWRLARGKYVALLDDDATADRSWLRTLLEAFTTVRPQPGCVGGRVTPIWEEPRPQWLSDKLLVSLTVADWSDTPHAVDDLAVEWLVGANLAFARAVLDQMGGFPTNLGRIGHRLLSGEEIYLQRRIIEAGLGCWYEPRARVGHCVPGSRMHPSWFRRRYYAQGLSDAAMWHMERRDESARRLRRGLRELGPLLRAGFAVPGLVRRVDDPDQFAEHCGVLWRLGFVAGLLRGQ